ncbi:Fe-S-containing hydro-lyase [Peptostreptococcus sp. D1]|uniref:Fe-S-containing hydro-lyase n=1 Tax=Peptostreptococcus sp. D1 TaxID=72304 RepID=UPI0008EA0376|nr:Fe-S-containing hydro-lyase [Peptostreptococcus sp. D1]SFE19267.1 fumarate hydratase subunit beta [Peptostreptococcus sp. D1]
MIELNSPFSEEEIRNLKAGDIVRISGVLYTARDAAHKRLCESIKLKEELPFDVKDQGIYYVGPSPTKPGEIIGAAGPTTSYRMDDLTIPLLEKGLRIMIGKGKRSDEVIFGMNRYGAVYLVAIGGAGAYISSSIKSSEIVAYEDLGPEAIRKIEVENMILTVCIDTEGNNLYEH